MSEPFPSTQINTKQTDELTNFVKEAMTKITSLSTNHINKYKEDRKTQLQEYHSTILTKMQNHQVKKTVDAVKQGVWVGGKFSPVPVH